MVSSDIHRGVHRRSARGGVLERRKHLPRNGRTRRGWLDRLEDSPIAAILLMLAILWALPWFMCVMAAWLEVDDYGPSAPSAVSAPYVAPGVDSQPDK